MAVKDLEFRGIAVKQLGMYFEELGAKQLSDSFPYIYAAEGWSGQILNEEELSFTKTFRVNAVKVRFQAGNDEDLKDLIQKYRYKTTRIGG